MTEQKNDERKITLGALARAVGGQLTGDETLPVSDVTHDSRQVQRGTLFIAIQGAQFDAHGFAWAWTVLTAAYFLSRGIAKASRVLEQ